jgi:NAD(P)-dependent dehydrogenase (short-subunit alcohol dehydrogenase family)
MQLHEKTALITGGTLGIGRAIAQAFAREGARVVVTGRDAAHGEAAIRAITDTGGRISFLQTDQGNLEEVRRLATQATQALGQVDILVNNAGVSAFGPTETLDEATFDRMMTINVKGTYFLTAALVPSMVTRGYGKIINISSMVAAFGMQGMAAYSASKAAVELLTKSWAAEFGPRGINVNAIAPGPVRTEAAIASGRVDQIATTVPAKRAARPEEIAAAALYLASDDASFVHGVILPVDGGRSAT